VIAGSSAAQVVETEDSPALVISYRALPSHRAALQEAMTGPVARNFAHWQAQGLIRDYRLLVNRYVDAGTPDAVAVIGFADAAAERRWRSAGAAVAASGLTSEALSWVDEIRTAPVDRVRAQRSEPTSARAAWLVIPYHTLVSEDEYLKYADGYVVPQFEGWMKAGVLSHYEILVNRYPAGRPWNAMVLLEYRDDAALAKREAVVTAVREQLKNEPAWKAISDTKKNIRTELQLVVADAVGASPRP